MKRITFIAVIAALIAAATASATVHPPNPHQHHVFTRQLCSKVQFVIPLPQQGDIWTDEHVNRKDLQAFPDGPNIIYFGGANVSGRIVQMGQNRGLIQAAHFVPGCVSLRVEWWR